ncbi:unnamed protein product [Symbiodinium sp. CCMP2592]|nr:unnamed protein product [Symbiodinium sp. CCMP2592]
MGVVQSCKAEEAISNVTSNVHRCYFPMWAVRVSDFLEMSGPPEPHEVLQDKGLLHRYDPSMFVIFVSHQWLSSEHPDPRGQKVKIFQETLLGMIDESLPVAEDVVSRSDDKNLSSEMRRHIADGFIFFDWFSIPQKSPKHEGNPNNGAALAVRSIPAYVELSSLFIALVPELTHKESPQLVNYATWLSRGWCRAELWCRLLSNKLDTSIIVVYSATEAEFLSPLDWHNRSIVEGEFTVEADRKAVVRLGEVAVESKIRHLQEQGYRFYTALRPQLLCKERKDQSVDEFLQRFCYDGWDEALHDSSGMNAVMCAVMSGDTKILKLLAQCRADMNHTLQGMGDLGYYDTQTVLMAATKSQQHPSVLQTLIELEADVNARARTGLVALYMCRSPEHVKVLLEHRAEMPHFVMTGVASFACPETVRALLSFRCDPNQTGDPSSGPGFGPLHAVALFSRRNRRAVATAKLLLEHRADINARKEISGILMRQHLHARAHLAVKGFASCNMVMRLRASMAGLSPLGYAAMVGHEGLTKLYLEHGADPMPNDRGDTPADLARNNHHYHLLQFLEVSSVAL